MTDQMIEWAPWQKSAPKKSYEIDIQIQSTLYVNFKPLDRFQEIW